MSRGHLAIGRTIARDRTIENVRMHLVRRDMRRAAMIENALTVALVAAVTAFGIAAPFLV